MKKMKEKTYGWYPSVRDVYLSKNEPTPYHLECLYKFKDSGYYNPIVDPPEPAFVIRGITPSPAPSRSRPATCVSNSAPHARSNVRRPKSVSVPKFRPVPKVSSIPTPVWKRAPSETSWGVISPESGHVTQPCPHPPSTPRQQEKTESKPQLQWPTQQILTKYDKPLVSTAMGTAEEVFGTPIPPREAYAGGDSGYVFIPTGDGGVEVYSPPLYWPESHPRPITPQHSASSKASLGSAEGITARREVQEHYDQQALKEKEKKRKQLEQQRRFDNMLRQQQYQQTKKQPEPPKSASRPASNPSIRRERIKSATTYRCKASIPQRPVYSARPSKAASDTAVYTQHGLQDEVPAAIDSKVGRAWEEECDPVISSPHHHRPNNPLPPTPSLEDLVIEEDRSSSPDYQEVVDMYGWRAEVHGDPYNIKKTTKRLPYTVKCAEPELAPEPPKVHMESKETFFINTIPRRKATFDVQQDWLSEGLHAQRIELQKREGVNYRYKTFGFAY